MAISSLPEACLRKYSGMHQVEITLDGHHILGSPLNFKITYPTNAQNVKAFGPGLVTGIINDDKGIIYIQTDKAGPGLLQIAIQGPKNGFKLAMNNEDENDGENYSTMTINYQPYMPGLYIINILWS
ncbi:hypothetical protein MXB_1321, partial [Myxobolus squamalis]